MKRILYVATVAEHFYYFHLPCFKFFKEIGWQVDVACHGDRILPFCDNRFDIHIKRSPADKENLTAYRELKKIIKNGHYDIIHCRFRIARENSSRFPTFLRNIVHDI